MAFNVDRIKVILTLNVEFSPGAHDVEFEYVPADDCPLRAAALAKWHEIRDAEWRVYLAEAKPADPTITM